jgi:hypothetical protein
MTNHPARPVRFQITQLRLQSITKSVESIVVVLFTTVMAAFLPNVLARVLLGNQLSFEQSAAMEQVLMYLGYIPVVFLVIGALHFLFVMVTNWMRERQVNALQQVLKSLEMEDGMTTESSDTNSLAEVMMDSAKSNVKSAKRGRKAAKRK